MPDKPYVTRPQNKEALQKNNSEPLLREWLSAREVAQLLGVHVYTVQRWCREGKLKARRREHRATIPWRIHYTEVSKRQAPAVVKKLRERRKQSLEPQEPHAGSDPE